MRPLRDLVDKLIDMNSGSPDDAARQLGVSPASLSRWQSGQSRPREHHELRMRAIVDGTGDLFAPPISPKEDHPKRLEEAISATIHALREEFHRTATVSTRQESLDLVAALVFAHVTSIDHGGSGIGRELLAKGESTVTALNCFVQSALVEHLPNPASNEGRLSINRFFAPLSDGDERFAQRLVEIFEHDANAFRELHRAGRNDLINEVFSRFMSNSFVDEKEMGQYLTPPEITRFMVEVGFHALSQSVRARLLDQNVGDSAGVILDPSCGVGSFLAETIRLFHRHMRLRHGEEKAGNWLTRFVGRHVVGIDKSERMIRLAMINLGLFGTETANLYIANALQRVPHDGCPTSKLEGQVELILTNPPFGATYSGTDISRFSMGRGRAKAESEILFLERYTDWLAPSGVLVSVVPDSILTNRGIFAELRLWLRMRCHIEAVFSLPAVTFAGAGTSTKTSVLVLRKHGLFKTESVPYFGEAKEVGFNVITRSGQRRRIRNSQTDLPTLLAEYNGEWPAKIGRHRALAPDSERWDPAYHIGLPENIVAVIDHPKTSLIKVGDVAKLVDERVDRSRELPAEFEYIEISDVDPRTGLVGHKRILATEAPSRARRLIRAGDVLVSTVRPERGGVGLVPIGLDQAVCSTGFAVLRCLDIHPMALVWLLKSDLVRQQMIRNNIGIAYPAISEQTCLNLVLPVTRESLSTLSETAITLAEAQVRFEQIRVALATQVSTLDRGYFGGFRELRESPNLVDGGKPRSVTDIT